MKIKKTKEYKENKENKENKEIKKIKKTKIYFASSFANLAKNITIKTIFGS